MKRMPFQRPTSHYDDRVIHIDEQICALIQQRKMVSDNNPGYPPFELIAAWAKKYGFYEDYLKVLFGNLRTEDQFRPHVEPAVFQKHIPLLKSTEKDGDMYTITFIRQYDNASVVCLHVDSVPATREEEPSRHHPHRFLEMSIGGGYDCWQSAGGGSRDHFTYEFVVFPRLSDTLTGLTFVFHERKSPHGDLTTFELTVEA